MKKVNALAIFFILWMTVPSIAQVEKGTHWYIGAGGNANFTWIIDQNTYGQDDLTNKGTLGWIGNLNVGFDFSDNWGFKLEAGYGRMGQKYTGTRDGKDVTRDIKLDYLLFPIMVKFRAGGEVVKFYAMTGPQLGILMKAEQSYLVDGQPAPPYHGIDVSQTDIKERYTQAAAFIRLDAGLEITPGKHLMINIGFSNAYSITDLNSESWRMYDADGDYKISHNYYAGMNIGINYVF